MRGMLMINKSKWRKKIAFLLAMAGLFSTNIPILAAEHISEEDLENFPSTGIYMDVVKTDTDSRLRVTVPMFFAFVVNGTKNTSDTVEISVAEGTLMLPNITVDVIDHGNSYSDYNLNVTGDSKLMFRNYSTINQELNANENTNNNQALRQGAEVKLSGYIENIGTSEERKYWEVVDTKPEAIINDFKKYTFNLKDNIVRYAFNQTKIAEDNKLWIDSPIELEKPLMELGYGKDGLAKIPSEKELLLDIEVGGIRSQYNQVEESVKAGHIVWFLELKR
jgi:hypothetical protein